MTRTRSTVTAATVLAVAAVTAVWASVSLAAQQEAPADPVDSFSRTTDDQAAREVPRPSDTATGGAGRSSAQPPVPRPERVLVPSLGVDAAVVATGVTPRGDAEIPRDGDLVGWYQFGSRPGDSSGSSVLIGHRDTDAEGPGALFDLDELRAGDPVRGQGGDSVPALRGGGPAQHRQGEHFRTRSSAGPASPVWSSSPAVVPYLPEAGGYQENVVVVARPLDSKSAGAER